MYTLLDIPKYPKKSFEHFRNSLLEKKFTTGYLKERAAINGATGILWDISQGNKDLKPIIEGMDKIAKIRSEKSKSMLEKMTETWLKGAYFKSYEKGYKISRSYYLKFIKSTLKPKNEEAEKKLKISGTKLFDKIFVNYRNKIARLNKTQKLNDLKTQFPKYDIEKAYSYAVISGKFALKNDDIKDFMRIITLLKK